MMRAMLAATVLSVLLACGDDGDAKPRTIEGSCTQFCEKWSESGCSGAGVLENCMQSCEDDAAEYPGCEDEAKAALYCFVRADLECQKVLDQEYPRVAGDACDAQDNALDACRQAAMPGSGADAGP